MVRLQPIYDDQVGRPMPNFGAVRPAWNAINRPQLPRGVAFVALVPIDARRRATKMAQPTLAAALRAGALQFGTLKTEKDQYLRFFGCNVHDGVSVAALALQRIVDIEDDAFRTESPQPFSQCAGRLDIRRRKPFAAVGDERVDKRRQRRVRSHHGAILEECVQALPRIFQILVGLEPRELVWIGPGLEDYACHEWNSVLGDLTLQVAKKSANWGQSTLLHF